MKQIKFITMLLLATLTFSFNACSSDDENEDLNNGNGKKIAKIVNEYGKDYIRTETFSYSNGKMTKYTAFYNGESRYTENNQTITYSGNTIIMDGLLDDDDCIQTYTLNKDGLAISCKIVDKDDAEGGDEYTFQYSDGYLIGMSCIHGDNYIFQYTNGNITKATEHETTFTLTYSDNENKGIMNPFFEEALFAHKPAFYMGILGKSTKNLAVSCTESDKWNTNNYTCIYALDNEGYVITANSSLDGKFTYTFE